jgi:hypothetical protein
MIGAKIMGLPDLQAALAGIVPKLRVRALRNALAAGARVVQRTARGATPVINPGAVAVRKGYRKPGTVRDAISVRTSKAARKAGDVGVFVNVRPAKRGKRGKGRANDPYYWQWLEFGHRIIRRYAGKYTDFRLRGRGRLTGLAKRRKSPIGFVPGVKFLQKGVTMLPEALQIFIAKIGPQIEKLNRPKAPPP